MANITAGMVKELREKTGAGMMDCKAALGETEGNIEAAVDWLRKKGLAKAAKKSGRVAAEGLVAVAVAGTRGVVVEVNSETDFVARNEQFQALVRAITQVALETGGSVEQVLASPAPGGGTVADALSSAIATIGENMTLRRVAHLSVKSGVVGGYAHGGSRDLGRIGTLVALESAGKAEGLQALAKGLAQHVAASNPLALDASGIDKDTIAREKAILAEKNAGKPPHVLDKIVESGLKAFYKENCLLEQHYALDETNKLTVAQVVKAAEGPAGAPIALTGYVRIALGEGVDKGGEDFAAEVASLVPQT